MGDFFSNAAQGISGMFGKNLPGVGPAPPVAAPDPGDTGPWATTGGGTLPTQDPSVSTAPVRGGLMPTGKEFNPWSVLPAAVGGLGSIIGLARGQGSATDKALKAQAKSTQPLQNVANQQLQQFSQNQLSPAQEAELKLKQDADKAKWAQYFADHGIPIGSSELNTMNLVDLQGLALKNQMLQQEFNNAYQGIGMAKGNLSDLARQQALQDAEQRKAWSDFMAALGKLGTDIGPIFT